MEKGAVAVFDPGEAGRAWLKESQKDCMRLSRTYVVRWNCNSMDQIIVEVK